MVHDTVQGTGAITTTKAETFLTATRRWIPAPNYQVTVRDPVTTDEDLATSGGWSQLLQDLIAVRTIEETTDEYYHGIIAGIEVRAARGVARQVASPRAAQIGPPARVDRIAPGRLRIRWDAGTHPTALVRDRVTGHILAISRSGSLVLESRVDPNRVEVLLSDARRPASPTRPWCGSGAPPLSMAGL